MHSLYGIFSLDNRKIFAHVDNSRHCRNLIKFQLSHEFPGKSFLKTAQLRLCLLTLTYGKLCVCCLEGSVTFVIKVVSRLSCINIDLPNLGIIDLSHTFFATRLPGQYLHIVKKFVTLQTAGVIVTLG